MLKSTPRSVSEWFLHFAPLQYIYLRQLSHIHIHTLMSVLQRAVQVITTKEQRLRLYNITVSQNGQPFLMAVIRAQQHNQAPVTATKLHDLPLTTVISQLQLFLNTRDTEMDTSKTDIERVQYMARTFISTLAEWRINPSSSDFRLHTEVAITMLQNPFSADVLK